MQNDQFGNALHQLTKLSLGLKQPANSMSPFGHPNIDVPRVDVPAIISDLENMLKSEPSTPPQIPQPPLLPQSPLLQHRRETRRYNPNRGPHRYSYHRQQQHRYNRHAAGYAIKSPLSSVARVKSRLDDDDEISQFVSKLQVQLLMFEKERKQVSERCGSPCD